MKYIVETINVRTIESLGKKVADCSLKDEEGVITDKVGIWQEFPDFQTITFGATVEGTIVTNDKGYKTLKPIFQPKQGGNPEGKMKMAEKMVDYKAKTISAAQDNKENAIKVAATMGHAVNIVVAMIKDQPMKDASVTKNMIKEWRKWLWEHWDVNPMDYQPFPSDKQVSKEEDVFNNF